VRKVTGGLIKCTLFYSTMGKISIGMNVNCKCSRVNENSDFVGMKENSEYEYGAMFVN
jgi:hypothetical protein